MKARRCAKISPCRIRKTAGRSRARRKTPVECDRDGGRLGSFLNIPIPHDRNFLPHGSLWYWVVLPNKRRTGDKPLCSRRVVWNDPSVTY